MDMEYKDVPVELKAIDEKGEGVLRFIKFHQEDKDSDITLPGFVGRQDAVLLSGHNWKSDFPPLGHGSSFEADGATNFRFQLNMADERAKAWHSWLKMGHNLQQVSYGFSPYADGQERGQKDGKPVRFLKPRPDGSPGAKLHEVSFVVVGSGNDTAVLHVKQADEQPEKESRGVESEQPPIVLAAPPSALWHVVAPHHEAVDESPFEATRHYKRLKAGQAAGLYRRAFTLQWPGTIEAHKDSWGFLHHHVDDEGQPGAANLEACLRGMAFLKGWDGVFLPDEVREAMHAHWAAHLRDAGVEVPEFMARDAGLTMEQELDLFLPRAWSISDRKERVTEMLIRMGKAPVETFMHKFDRLAQHVAFLRGVAGQAGEAKRHLDDQEMIAQYAQRIQSERQEEEARVRAAEQAELQASFERMKARDQMLRR